MNKQFNIVCMFVYKKKRMSNYSTLLKRVYSM